ncbi:SpaH/EbpB family LPXTG-anchored major pilin [Bacillus cereus group sp. TH43LC]|uniref:SpaH/EbpB family LPXTG-anchored major pilin n=1 Tax=Bacillus cereus group TaxID=86661 RepID=UPI0022E28673|nr:MULTISPECIES: SpaH/EbpB family LPXTG-anchored major pilin [unclassified Bacillus cereus group]MDA1502139.1 SpaH/EbpB family LPXTG-anchored major pilin [Bacillus cereus group sp. TH43LC]MDA1788071.1 SpaH/EbpB family LPXTG-anchored major pilin [Bacillus cereus group sp. BY5-1LC]MDA1862018.1 SpaH/EbpB family LPXTG-anchored major pilin [Bacillus cereus group sp. BY128LC]
MKKFLSIFLIAILMFSSLPSMLTKAESKNKGTLTIHKFEQAPFNGPLVQGNGTTNVQIPKNAKPLAGVTFEIKQVASFEKISNDGKIAKEDVKPVEGAQPIRVTTKEEGIAFFDNLPIGRYEVKEISGPPHVNINPKTYTVDIPMTSEDGKVLTYDVHIYPKNETKRGAVELTKLGVKDKVLKGAEFSLFKADGTELEKGLVTDAHGKIRIGNLPYGHYYFKETKAPDGYVLDPKKYEFFIKESGVISEDGTLTSGEIVKVVVKNYEEPIIDKKINGDLESLPINTKTDYNYDIKTLIPEDIKDYKSYIVTDVLDSRLEIQGKPVVKIDGVVVDESVVEVAVEGQKVTAAVKDFSKLNGKKELHLQIKAQIRDGVETGTEIPNTAKIEFKNKDDVTKEKETKPVIVTPTTGSITLTKVDGKDGKKLEGAEFELRDKKGNPVEIDGKKVVDTSDKNGVITWNKIPYGEYQIVETKAPTYEKEDGTTGSYQLLREPIYITIDANHKAITLTVENNKSGWILPATGGIGTMIFTVIGLVLMLAAAFVFFRKKAGNN